MFTHILLATDGSEHAEKAAEAAGAMAEKFSARLTVLHVFMPPTSTVMPLATTGSAAGMDATLVAQWAEAARDSVARHTARALETTGATHSLRQEIGHPAEAIVRVANEEKCDLIVIGSRGLSGLKEFLLGSVSNRVLHHARCPVLVEHCELNPYRCELETVPAT